MGGAAILTLVLETSCASHNLFKHAKLQAYYDCGSSMDYVVIPNTVNSFPFLGELKFKPKCTVKASLKRPKMVV